MLCAFLPHHPYSIEMQISRSATIDSLGACQGAKFLDGTVYLYGDREVGMMRTYHVQNDSLVYTGHEYRFTQDGKDVINHPTGIAYHKGMPVFVGNSVRLNKEGTLWKALIYQINWEGFLKTGTLDNNLISTIEDDACIQGCRPEYVKYKGKWYVATADYGNKGNEVRLYDAALLAKASKTSEPGMVVKKFACTPWVQNLCYLPEKNILVLIQNQEEGRKWRFTYVDLAKSLDEGTASVIKVSETDKPDELEGFTFLKNDQNGVAVTSSRSNNVHCMKVNW
ncbi:hypothetical protein DXN05_21985 [Deminuibacter soli]|uniref:Uncharacterized protein n=1 Tax=Deminuibacter soli TaxID=2291815 RepID=A0A3E1NE17_9BACT|nr:hypothetical protein DXN05_21985 [Deminuibacter soli]